MARQGRRSTLHNCRGRQQLIEEPALTCSTMSGLKLLSRVQRENSHNTHSPSHTWLLYAHSDGGTVCTYSVKADECQPFTPTLLKNSSPHTVNKFATCSEAFFTPPPPTPVRNVIFAGIREFFALQCRKICGILRLIPHPAPH